MSESKSTVVLSIPAPKCRFLLDTGIFRALCGRYRVLVSGYLSERPDIIATYGGPDVEFIRQASPSGGFGGALTRMTESARELGFQFQHRKHPWVGMAWRATSRYRSLEPPIRRGVGRRLVVNALAVAARKRASWRRYTRWASRWIVDSGLEDLLARERPAAVVMTGQGQGSPQELVLGLAAERLGLRTIWLPVTPDDPMYNGHLVPDHDAVCAWGPVMRRQLEEFHGIPPTRVIDLGNVMTRLQEDLMAAAGPGVALRERIGIPAGRPIVTYFSVVNSSATETVPAVDALAAAARDGRLSDAAILLRPSPAEDAGRLARRYENNPHVWVQDTCAHEFDGAGPGFFTDHAWTVKESSVLVLGSLTSALYQAAAWGVPIVLNATKLRRYPDDAYSPASGLDTDFCGFISAGLAVARSLDELCVLTEAHLIDPAHGKAACGQIARDWDYRNAGYVEELLRMIEAPRLPGASL